MRVPRSGPVEKSYRAFRFWTDHWSVVGRPRSQGQVKMMTRDRQRLVGNQPKTIGWLRKCRLFEVGRRENAIPVFEMRGLQAEYLPELIRAVLAE
jgi:hypothetical protein